MTAPAVPPDAPEELRKLVRYALGIAYDAGFANTAEGWNNEYPGDAHESEHYLSGRREWIERVLDPKDGVVGAALGSAGLLARSEGEAVGLLRRLVAAAGIMDSAESRLEAMVTVAWDARAFLSRSESRPGPDAPSYGALAEALRRFERAVSVERVARAESDADPEDMTAMAALSSAMKFLAETHNTARVLLARLPGAQEPEKT